MSPSRVSTTRYRPVASKARRSSCATVRTIVFSKVPSTPTAPGSRPPCPGSTTIRGFGAALRRRPVRSTGRVRASNGFGGVDLRTVLRPRASAVSTLPPQTSSAVASPRARKPRRDMVSSPTRVPQPVPNDTQQPGARQRFCGCGRMPPARYGASGDGGACALAHCTARRRCSVSRCPRSRRASGPL